MPDCIFCKIINNEIPSTRVYEDENALAFLDIQPQAPTHIIVIPKKHYASLAECDDIALMGHLIGVCAKVAKEKNGLEDCGYRVVTNIGEHGMQTVKHLHLHILGGRQLGSLG